MYPPGIETLPDESNLILVLIRVLILTCTPSDMSRNDSHNSLCLPINFTTQAESTGELVPNRKTWAHGSFTQKHEPTSICCGLDCSHVDVPCSYKAIELQHSGATWMFAYRNAVWHILPACTPHAHTRARSQATAVVDMVLVCSI